MNKGIIITTIAIFASLGVFGILSKRPVGAEIVPVVLGNAQVIEWTKPTTDEGWAEDVKKESFDIKSTGVLSEMRTVHAEKLLRVQKGKKEVFECRACMDFKYREAHPEATQAEVDANYADELSKANWEVEKLQQSVERMDKELELREKGFVVPDKDKEGVKTKKSDLDKVDVQFIRKVND